MEERSLNSMAEIKLVSEWFVRPKYEVEASKHPYHLSPTEVGMLSIHPIQKGLLFPFTTTHYNSTYINNHSQILSNLIHNLKHSLSIALIHFYPLAGRFVTQKYPHQNASSFHIDCTKGPGVRLIHAAALDAAVSDITGENDAPTSLVYSLFELGEKTVNFDGHTRALVSVQVTQLKDGVFIGFTMNHSVADGTSFIHFVSMLSEIFNSQQQSISRVPVFNYKPWVDVDPNNKDRRTVLKLPHLEPENLIQRSFDQGLLKERIFHFSAKTIAALKARANEEVGPNNSVLISSYQALSAFMWRSIIRARKLASDQPTTCSMLMNARVKFDPPVSNDYFGNFIGLANGECSVGDLLSHDLGWAALHLREAILKQDTKAVMGFYGAFADNPMVVPPSENDSLHGSNKVIIGGSARFDMYGPEFGLGRAVAARMGFANKEDGKITANPGCEGGGSVDLEVCLKPLTMEALVADSEFISFC